MNYIWPEGMQRSQVIEVALVDDDPHYRDMFAFTVQDHPEMALVHVADRGREMLGWLEDHQPDVLLVDLGLPDVPGLEVVKFGAMRWPQMNMAVVTLFKPRRSLCRPTVRQKWDHRPRYGSTPIEFHKVSAVAVV